MIFPCELRVSPDSANLFSLAPLRPLRMYREVSVEANSELEANVYNTKVQTVEGTFATTQPGTQVV